MSIYINNSLMKEFNIYNTPIASSAILENAFYGYGSRAEKHCGENYRPSNIHYPENHARSSPSTVILESVQRDKGNCRDSGGNYP
jgi:hypothetical protein